MLNNMSIFAYPSCFLGILVVRVVAMVVVRHSFMSFVWSNTFIGAEPQIDVPSNAGDAGRGDISKCASVRRGFLVNCFFRASITFLWTLVIRE